MNNRRKTLPPLSGKVPVEMRPLLEAIKEILETGEGVRGDSLDQKITYRDLLESGLARLRLPGGGTAGGLLPNAPQPNLAIPPGPSEFYAEGGFYGIVTLTWGIPQEVYNNHGFTNIYRNAEDNFATAELIGRDSGFMYNDKTRDDLEPGTEVGYYYWITYTSDSDVEGPPNSPDGTYAIPLPDTELLLEQLTRQINESQLAIELATKIDTTALLAATVETGLADEITVRQEEDEALAQQITTVTGRVDETVAAVSSEATARAEGDEALAQQVTTVATRVGENESAVQQQLQSINGLSAQYTLRLDVNGYVSGFGAYNDGSRADFGVVADRFYIASPSGGLINPFIVDSGTVYINNAVIKNASIEQGKLGPISFGKIVDSGGNPVTTLQGKLRAEAIDVESLQIGNANITGVIQSNATGAFGRPRWRLDKNAGLEMNGASNGGRMEIRDNVIKVFDQNGTLRVQIGDLLA